jgi:hypothetical protein
MTERRRIQVGFGAAVARPGWPRRPPPAGRLAAQPEPQPDLAQARWDFGSKRQEPGWACWIPALDVRARTG